MDAQVMLRQLLRTPSTYRAFLHPTTRPRSRTFALLASSASQHRYLSLPRIIQPSFWASLIPKPFRRSQSPPSSTQPHPKEWNPATPYIILSLLVGSQAIQILWLKRDREHFTRRAEAKIGVLREVIERVQAGEEVEVEKVLGTGDVAAEREWKEVLAEIEGEEVLFRSKKKRRALRQAEAAEAGTVEEIKDERGEGKAVQEGNLKVETYKGAKFY